jgi:hypothetical protein
MARKTTVLYVKRQAATSPAIGPHFCLPGGTPCGLFLAAAKVQKEKYCDAQ